MREVVRVIAYLALPINVAEQENAKDDGNHIPLWEDEAVVLLGKLNLLDFGMSYLNVWVRRSLCSMFWPMSALNSTKAGICSRQTCKAYADPISIESAMLPFIAKDMAF